MATQCGPDLLNFGEKKQNIILVIYSPAVCTVYHNGTTSHDIFLLFRQERTKKNPIHLTNTSYKEYKMNHIELSAMDRNGNQFYRTSLSHMAEE